MTPIGGFSTNSSRKQQLEATIVSLQQQGSRAQETHKEPKICPPMKFDQTRSRFRGFPTDASRVGLVGVVAYLEATSSIPMWNRTKRRGTSSPQVTLDT